MHLGLHNKYRYGNAQGGALYTLADVTIAQSIIAQLPEGTNISTLELKMNYFKPGQGKYLRAKGSILHWGRKTVGGECDILDESGQLADRKSHGNLLYCWKKSLKGMNFIYGKLHLVRL
jgi:uncharacterized protein (TIGR00369 family)